MRWKTLIFHFYSNFKNTGRLDNKIQVFQILQHLLVHAFILEYSRVVRFRNAPDISCINGVEMQTVFSTCLWCKRGVPVRDPCPSEYIKKKIKSHNSISTVRDSAQGKKCVCKE